LVFRLKADWKFLAFTRKAAKNSQSCLPCDSFSDDGKIPSKKILNNKIESIPYYSQAANDTCGVAGGNDLFRYIIDYHAAGADD